MEKNIVIHAILGLERNRENECLSSEEEDLYHVVAKILLINRKYRKPYDYLAGSSIRFESFYLKFLWAYVAETILATSYIQKD
jgi:hypothetical protein